MEIRQLFAGYGENVRFYPPCQAEEILSALPPELADLLRQSDGVMETMPHPKTGERIDIQWLLCPGTEIAEDTAFYHEQYGVEGFAIATDGAGSPFLCQEDGQVLLFDPIDGTTTEAAPSLAVFYGGGRML